MLGKVCNVDIVTKKLTLFNQQRLLTYKSCYMCFCDEKDYSFSITREWGEHTALLSRAIYKRFSFFHVFVKFR